MDSPQQKKEEGVQDSLINRQPLQYLASLGSYSIPVYCVVGGGTFIRRSTTVSLANTTSRPTGLLEQSARVLRSACHVRSVCVEGSEWGEGFVGGETIRSLEVIPVCQRSLFTPEQLAILALNCVYIQEMGVRVLAPVGNRFFNLHLPLAKRSSSFSLPFPRTSSPEFRLNARC